MATGMQRREPYWKLMLPPSFILQMCQCRTMAVEDCNLITTVSAFVRTIYRFPPFAGQLSLAAISTKVTSSIRRFWHQDPQQSTSEKNTTVTESIVRTIAILSRTKGQVVALHQ